MSNIITDTVRERIRLNEKVKNNDYFRRFTNSLKTAQMNYFQLELKTISDLKQINELAQFYNVKYQLKYDEIDYIINAVINIDKNFVNNLDELISQFSRLNQQKQKDIKFNDKLLNLKTKYGIIFLTYLIIEIYAPICAIINFHISLNQLPLIFLVELIVGFMLSLISYFTYKKQLKSLKNIFNK